MMKKSPEIEMMMSASSSHMNERVEIYKKLASQALQRYESYLSGLSSISTVEASVSPNPEDVLFGRDRRYRLHPGNVLLRKLCDLNLPTFETLTKRGKNELTRLLLDSIRSRGGRFLKLDSKNKIWIEVSNEEARTKIAHRFRDARTQSESLKHTPKDFKHEDANYHPVPVLMGFR